jgi:transposase
MDNLGSHKSKAVRQAIRKVGARLIFLPKYSPDLNPIEKFFSKLKHGLRKTAARSLDAISDAIAKILDTVAPSECKNCFIEAGYERT